MGAYDEQAGKRRTFGAIGLVSFDYSIGLSASEAGSKDRDTRDQTARNAMCTPITQAYCPKIVLK